MKKKNYCDVTERIRGSSLLKTFLKPSLKMSSICYDFGGYNRKLCVNKPISFFSQHWPNVETNDIPTTKGNKRIFSSWFGSKISQYLNYFFCNRKVNSKNTKDYEQFQLLYPFSSYRTVDGL